MKNMRKTLAAGLAAVMIAGSMAGCGGTQELEELKAENERLTAALAEANTSLETLSQSMEHLESNAHDANAAMDNARNKLNAFSLLVNAQNAYIDFDREKVEAALDELEPYLQYLDGADLTAYYMILEYMEQPYNGTDVNP